MPESNRSDDKRNIVICTMIGIACLSLMIAGICLCYGAFAVAQSATASPYTLQPLANPLTHVVITTSETGEGYVGTLERGKVSGFNVSIAGVNVTAGMTISLEPEISVIYADGSGTSTPADISVSVEPRNITFTRTVTEKDSPQIFNVTFTVDVPANARDSDIFAGVRARGEMLNPSPVGNYHFVIGNGGNLPAREPASGKAAGNHTFSVYGTVLDDDGTPIPDTTIRLLEPVNSSFSSEDPGIQSTITDSQGRFQFIDVMTNADTCAITISYPDHKQYFQPGNSFRPVNASGIQYVNVTRMKIESDAPPSPSPVPSPAADAFVVLAVIGLVGLSRIRRH